MLIQKDAEQELNRMAIEAKKKKMEKKLLKKKAAKEKARIQALKYLKQIQYHYLIFF